MKKIIKLIFGTILTVTIFSVASTQMFIDIPVYAQDIPPGCPDGGQGPPSPGTQCPDGGYIDEDGNYVPPDGTPPPQSSTTDCQGVELGVGVDCDPLNPDENVIYTYMRAIIRFLSIGVGLVTVGMIVISGIRYITSSGNPQAVQDAKSKLLNAVLGLILFIFSVAIINYLIPGGLL